MGSTGSRRSPGSIAALLRRLARHAGCALQAHDPAAVPRFAGYLPGEGALAVERLIERLAPDRPVVPIIFYRAMLLAGDTAPVDALCAALAARGLAASPLIVTSLKDRDATAFLRGAWRQLGPAAIVTMTGFAANGASET